jgi:hypothetical protein
MSFKPSEHSRNNPGVRMGAGPATGQYYVTIAGERGMSPDGWHWGYLSGRVPELVKIKGPLVPGTRIQFKRMHGNTAVQWAILRDRKVMPQHSAGLPGATGMPGPGTVGFDAYSMHPGVRVVVPPAVGNPGYGSLLSALSIISKPAHGGAQSTANRGVGDINTIIMHTSEGGNPAGWFANTDSKASAHYSVYKTGRIYQSVPDKDVAWHAGSSSFNRKSLGIEIEGYANKGDWTDVQIGQAARLVAALAEKYNIPIDRDHIIGHNEVPGCKSGSGGGASCHTDPGPHWPWKDFLKQVKAARGGNLSAVQVYMGSKEVWALVGLGVAGGLTTMYWVLRLSRLRRERRSKTKG